MEALNRGERRYPTGPIEANHDDIRTPFRHDRDRILYSPEFRRLSGITQVISPLGHYVTHNRLTHSLEVAQIGRAIAETLLARTANAELVRAAGGLEPDVVEAAALAHDLGHPPFGHTAENTLNRKLKEKQLPGFEGNAQTFRILTQLSVHDTIYPGLNLTRATLSAVLKYPCGEVGNKKWGFYDDQASDFAFSRAHLSDEWRTPSEPPTEFRTLEAEIMDWADDAAYAIHDLEDFYKAGLIPLDKLRSSPAERQNFVESRITVDDVAKESPAEFEKAAETILSRNSPFLHSYSGGFLRSSLSAAILQRQNRQLHHRTEACRSFECSRVES